MYRSWLIHESSCLKPHWLGDIKLFSVKNSYMLLWLSLKRGFGGCRHGFGRCDGLGGLGGFGGFDGLGGFGRFDGFSGFEGFGGFVF